MACSWTASIAQANEPPEPVDLAAEVTQLVEQLDADRCDVRDRATQRLNELVDRPELAELLSASFRRALVAETASFELRARLAPIAARLQSPRQPDEPPERVDLDHLVRLLEADSYGSRAAAAARLTWSLGNEENIVPAVLALRRRLSDPNLDSGVRRELEPLWKQVRAAWLSSDPSRWDLPPVADEQIERWIDELARPSPEGWRETVSPQHEIARRELTDLLARDEYVARVKALAEVRLAGPVDPHAAARLQEIAELTLPGMVAEIWEDTLQGTRIATVQYLALGVPCQPEGAERPSLFDRVDDVSAHCVSGNSLSPGDWPVGIAFPSPIAEDKLFHLVNLPTPRHRLAYEATIDGDEAERLRALSRRTLESYLAAARPLTFRQTMMLDQLDADEVSKFAGRYFLAVDDQMFPPDVRHTPSGRASLHQTICIGLALNGARSAIDGLMTAIERDRFLKPSPGSPFNWPWVAALSIAVHDPWPEVERWLADQVMRTDPLVVGPEELQADPVLMVEQLPELREAAGRPPAADVGGSAAAILLARHNLPPWAFRLERVWQPPIDNYDIPACRFTAAEDRQAVLDWWSKRAGQPEREPVPTVKPVASP